MQTQAEVLFLPPGKAPRGLSQDGQPWPSHRLGPGTRSLKRPPQEGLPSGQSLSVTPTRAAAESPPSPWMPAGIPASRLFLPQPPHRFHPSVFLFFFHLPFICLADKKSRQTSKANCSLCLKVCLKTARPPVSRETTPFPSAWPRSPPGGSHLLADAPLSPGPLGTPESPQSLSRLSPERLSVPLGLARPQGSFKSSP